MEEGRGRKMEWQASTITLVEGYVCENQRKRLRLKKLRWTEDARKFMPIKDQVPRISWKVAGRMKEGPENRERIEEGNMRIILNNSKDCPITQLYLELGQFRARFKIQKMRLPLVFHGAN